MIVQVDGVRAEHFGKAGDVTRSGVTVKHAEKVGIVSVMTTVVEQDIPLAVCVEKQEMVTLAPQTAIVLLAGVVVKLLGPAEENVLHHQMFLMANLAVKVRMGIVMITHVRANFQLAEFAVMH